MLLVGEFSENVYVKYFLIAVMDRKSPTAYCHLRNIYYSRFDSVLLPGLPFAPYEIIIVGYMGIRFSKHLQIYLIFYDCYIIYIDLPFFKFFICRL